MADTNLENENEKEIPQPSQEPQQEPVISPKDNDELIIEIDESQKTAISPEQNEIDDEVAEEIEEIKKPIQSNKHHKKQQPPKQKAENTGGSKTHKGLYITIIILLVIGAAGYVFVIHPDMLAKKFPILVEKGIIKPQQLESVKTENKEIVVEQKAPETEQEIIPEEQTIQEEIVEQEQKVKTEKVKEKVITQAIEDDKRKEGIIAPKEVQQESRIVKKGRLVTPCWVISYSSVSSEATAIKNVAKLTTSEKKCGYYWIPDYSASGPKLFKIYIGPFTSKDAALAELPAIQTEASGAYVTEVK